MEKWDYIDLMKFSRLSYDKLDLTWDEIEFCVSTTLDRISAKKIGINLNSSTDSIFLNKIGEDLEIFNQVQKIDKSKSHEKVGGRTAR